MSCCCFRFFRKKIHKQPDLSVSLYNMDSSDISLQGTFAETKKPHPDEENQIKHYEKGSLSTSKAQKDIETQLEDISTESEEIKEESKILDKNPSNNKPDFESMFTPGFSMIMPCTSEVTSEEKHFEQLLAWESDKSWKLKVSKTFARIYLQKGTEENPELPMVKACFDMEINANPADLYFLLYDIDTRKQWDKSSVGEFIEIYKTQDVVGYYMLNKAPWPFSDRDFIERRFIRKRDNGDIEIYYREYPAHDFQPPKSKAERGRTLFGGQIFRKRISQISGEPTLLVTLVSQADMSGKIPVKAFEETLPNSLLKWYRSVRKELVKKVSLNRNDK